jgi:hypothetical protein
VHAQCSFAWNGNVEVSRQYPKLEIFLPSVAKEIMEKNTMLTDPNPILIQQQWYGSRYFPNILPKGKESGKLEKSAVNTKL